MNDYGLFYKENKDRLYAYLLRMTRDRQLALDLVQESFVRYLKRYGRHEFNKALLYTIGRNAALDAFRRQTATGVDTETYQDSGADPEQQVIDQEKFNQTMSAIAKLAPLDRELISLVATTDLTYQEIGRVLKISEANVKVRIHRARTKLREMLASGGE
ncbi:MAG: RNA polymerase sigma factor [Thermodesulfobacteriota bacterium]